MRQDPPNAVTILSAAQSHFARGETLALLDRWAEAAAAYAAAVAADPAYAEAWARRGVALAGLLDEDAALASLEQATRLRPRSAEIWRDLASVLSRFDHPEQAAAAADRALACDPACLSALLVRGNALRSLGQVEAALATFDQGIAIAPHHAVLRLNRAMCRLAAGDFAGGWADYEWRWHTGSKRQVPGRLHEEPVWLGQVPPAGKTILLHAEQGMGDTLQFCRYAPMLAERGATVLLATAPAMHGLLASLDGVAKLISTAEIPPPFDLQCPLLSLPLAFRSDLDTLPADVPYLAPPPRHVRAWQARLGPPRRPRIGVAWAGNPDYPNDRNRSLTLDQAARMLPGGAELYCLQREMRPVDVPAMAMLPCLTFFGPELAELADTAALAAEMDLVIAVDTGVLHLAGALGLPVWGLLPFASDWRWMQGREDTPWYPTMRLFRQPAPGAWGPVLDRVRQAAETFVTGHTLSAGMPPTRR